MSLRELLAEKFRPPGYALFWEVANATGSRGERYADAVALSLWPSRGIYLSGFELKASRADWKRELDDPRKSHAVQQFCTYWWIVAEDGVVDASELPPTWGLLVPGSRRGKPALYPQVFAPKLDAKPLDLGFVASLLRRAADRERRLLQAEHQRGFGDGQKGLDEAVEKKLAAHVADVARQRDHLLAIVRNFEAESGVGLGLYDASLVGSALREVLALGNHWQGMVGDVNLLEGTAKSILARIGAWRRIAEASQAKPPQGARDAKANAVPAAQPAGDGEEAR